MSWPESRLGCFERPLTCVESFFKTLADSGAPINREHWAVRVYAQFHLHDTVEDPVAAVRHAWKTMRFDHPQIASFAKEESRMYQTSDPVSLASWLTETFRVIRDIAVEDLLASLRPTRFPSLYYLPQSSEILIQVPHWYIDGTGAISLLNNIFDAIARPRQVAFGTEGKNLSPGVEEAANLSYVSTEIHDQAVVELLAKYTSNLPSTGLPLEIPNQIPGATRRLEITLRSDFLHALRTACTANAITITAAVHAALITSTQRLAPDCMKACNYTSWGTFSLRPYLNPAFTNPKAHPVNLYLCGLPLTLKPTTFSADASQLNTFYKQLALPSIRAKIWPTLAPFVRSCTAMIRQSPPQDMHPATGPVLSSIGIVDRYLQGTYGSKVEVSRFWLSSEVLSREPLVYVWTWQEHLSLSVCYNENFYTLELMRRLLEITRDTLVKELDLPISDDASILA
ncbi:MAG: hypothetical protein Q9214_003666 [Letrouitia sp. 1 TL-2023]